MNDIAIKVDGLSKLYRLGERQGRYKTLRETITDFFAAPYRKMRNPKSGIRNPESEVIWALKDVSFKIKRGEVVGIIGRNGAGKSTLLKVLSRITEPTKGYADIYGRIGSLLEVGTGFHPELTGRENIYLNGAILGMKRSEIDRKFDEIVAFAEVERFIDTPVKHYSSGMYLRLAFAVAAHLETEILLVDEVLAVGDVQFQKKCLGKMSEVAKHGRTVLFVSHNMLAVRNLCSRAILLENGRLELNAGVEQVMNAYSVNQASDARSFWRRSQPTESGSMRFEELSVKLISQQSALKLRCDMYLRCMEPCPNAFVAVDIRALSLDPIMQAMPSNEPFIEGFAGDHKITVEIPLPNLIPGVYLVDFWVGPHYTRTYDCIQNQLTFEVLESPIPGRTHPHSQHHGYIAETAKYLIHRELEG